MRVIVMYLPFIIDRYISRFNHFSRWFNLMVIDPYGGTILRETGKWKKTGRTRYEGDGNTGIAIKVMACLLIS